MFLKDNYVCGRHYKQLGPRWQDTPGPFNKRIHKAEGAGHSHACSFPGGVEGVTKHQKSVVANRGSFASRKHSKVLLLMKNGAFIQMGGPLCRTHHKYLDEHNMNKKGYWLKPRIKTPVAEGPTFSQMSAYNDEPIQLAQDFKLRMSQELPVEHAPPPPAGPTKPLTEQKQSEDCPDTSYNKFLLCRQFQFTKSKNTIP